MPAVAAVDAVGQLEAGDLAGDGDVRHDVDAADAAERRNGRARAGELVDERRREIDLHVGVLRFDDQAAEAAVPRDEIELVREARRLPVERRVHRQTEPVPLPVEDDVPGDGRAAVVLDRHVVQAELVRARRPQDQLEIGQLLVGRHAEIALGVDRASRDAGERSGSATCDGHVGRRKPETDGAFDVIRLARRGIVDGARFVLGVSGRGHQQNSRGRGERGDVQSKSRFVHNPHCSDQSDESRCYRAELTLVADVGQPLGRPCQNNITIGSCDT